MKLWTPLFAFALFLAVLSPQGQTQTQSKPVQKLYDRVNLDDQDFSGQNLAGTTFKRTNMRKMNLSGANLSKAIFARTNVEDSDLTNANLRGALLDRANFTNSKLTNADMRDVLATGSVFKNTDITGVDFTNAVLDTFQTAEFCQRAKGVNPITKVDTRKSLGCK
ncbi:MAG: pentapeptide repeat-containing protein [Gloeobacterales cyanobacterium]